MDAGLDKYFGVRPTKSPPLPPDRPPLRAAVAASRHGAGRGSLQRSTARDAGPPAVQESTAAEAEENPAEAEAEAADAGAGGDACADVDADAGGKEAE